MRQGPTLASPFGRWLRKFSLIPGAMGTYAWARLQCRRCPYRRNACLQSRLHLDRLHQFLHVIDARLEHLSFTVIQLDLDHALDAFGAKDHRHADEEAADAVLLITIGSAGEDAFFIANDRLRHGDRR